MATDTARSTAPRHLWQVPVFFLGSAAFLGVLFFRPQLGPDTFAAAEHQLREARKALEQTPPDAASAVQRGLRVIALSDRYPQLVGEAHFIVGSARLKLADDPAAADAARERLQARQHLEQAEQHGLPEADRPKLQYRLAKTMLLLGGDPVKAAALLEKSVDADDPAEGYGLLAEAYSRQAPPNLAKAVEAGKQQLDRALRAGDARAQAIARFRLGDLNLQLKNMKDGRLMLTKVGTEAPPDLFFAARVMLAKSYQEASEWANAARNWEQARQNSKLSPPEKGKILYHLGRCYAQEQRTKEATAVLQEAVALGGEEGQAAGLRLAELMLDSDAAASVTTLDTALQPVQGPDDYHNALLPIDDARQIGEAVIRLTRERADWDLGRKAVAAYARIAKPGKDEELSAALLDAQAVALAEKAKTEASETAPAFEEQARDLWRQAAAAYERAAGKVPASDTAKAEQAALLWQSAQLAKKAEQPQRAQEVLLRLTQLDGALDSVKMAEAWFLIGNTYDVGHQYANAREAYQKCLAMPGPYTRKALFALAEVDLAEGKFDDAERGYQELLKSIRESADPDAELQEQAVYALGRVAFARQTAVKEELREYGTAEQRLLGALQQYPESRQVPKARQLLGLVYWTEALVKSRPIEQAQGGALALSPEERKNYQRQRDEFLTKSAQQYEKIEERLLARQRAGERLTPDETQCLKQALFWGADCYFWLQKYEEAVRRYGALALRYQGWPEEMIALSQLTQSYMYMGQNDKVPGILKRMQDALDKIPEANFDGRLKTHRRDYWEKWLKEATKPALPPSPQPEKAAPGK
jgi:tetratricopeptide (TPR) repeat protein